MSYIRLLIYDFRFPTSRFPLHLKLAKALSLRENIYLLKAVTLTPQNTPQKIQKKIDFRKMKRSIRRLLIMQTIKVAIAEDHKIFRKGIILSMQPYQHIQFVMEAGNGQELIDQLPGEAVPEVILMDIRMPGMDGIATTKYISSHYPGIHIICLTMFEDREFVQGMIASGASGYLLKNAEPREINEAIIDVKNRGYHNNSLSNGIIFSSGKKTG